MSNITNVRAGLGSVGNYQVSGVPWITGSASLGAGEEDRIQFPYVTKSFTVINVEAGTNGDLYLHFNATGSGDVIDGRHFVILNDDKDSITISCKCKEIYLSNPDGSTATAYTVIAELTTIATTNMYPLTGSGLTELI